MPKRNDVKPKRLGNSGETIPALNQEARENELISLAYDRAEEQLRAGTASSQVITHFLRMGTEREKREREKLSAEVEVLNAKRKAYESSERIEMLYEEAIRAMRSYGGHVSDEH